MKLHVFHIPQVPMQAFYVEVESVEEGVKLMNTLAQYDIFQYENNVKGDYCNTNGLEMWDESLTEEDLMDMRLEDRWVDWYHESAEGFWENPREYLNDIKEGVIKE